MEPDAQAPSRSPPALVGVHFLHPFVVDPVVNPKSDIKSFDLSFSALLSPLEIAEVYYGNYDVGIFFGISNHEGIDISVV